MSDNKEATAKEFAVRKAIAYQEASERFSAYRRGWQDGTCIRAIVDVRWQEDYEAGYRDGRQTLRSLMAKKRKDYGLKPEGTVHIA